MRGLAIILVCSKLAVGLFSNNDSRWYFPKPFFIVLNSSELLLNLPCSAICGPAFSASEIKRNIYICLQMKLLQKKMLEIMYKLCHLELGQSILSVFDGNFVICILRTVCKSGFNHWRRISEGKKSVRKIIVGCIWHRSLIHCWIFLQGRCLLPVQDKWTSKTLLRNRATFLSSW